MSNEERYKSALQVISTWATFENGEIWNGSRSDVISLIDRTLFPVTKKKKQPKNK